MVKSTLGRGRGVRVWLWLRFRLFLSFFLGMLLDFTIDQLDYRNTELLQTFVTGHGRILPRKYTGLPARYQRRMANAIKRARQMLLMK